MDAGGLFVLTSSSPSSSNIRGCSCAGGAEQNAGEEEEGGNNFNGIDNEVDTDPQHDLHTCLNVPALRAAIRKSG